MAIDSTLGVNIDKLAIIKEANGNPFNASSVTTLGPFYLQSLKVGNKITLKTKNLKEAVSGTNLRFSDVAKDLIAAVNGGATYHSKYESILTLESIEEGEVDSFTLDFFFGWKNLYDCKAEVADQILNLVKGWGYIPEKPGSNLYGGPIPSTAEFAMAFGKAITSEFSGEDAGAYSDLIGDVSADVAPDDTNSKNKKSNESVGSSGPVQVTGLASNIDAVMQKAITKIDSLYSKSMDISNRYKVWRLQIGKFQSMPFIPQDIHYDFDFTQVDQDGYPFKGSITFSNCKVVVPNSSDNIGAQILQ